jgi:hypothetical protein
MVQKSCKQCDTQKNLTDFAHKRNVCKSCIYENQKKWVLKNKVKTLNYSRDFRLKNLEKTKKVQKNWYEKNKEKALQTSKNYRLNNVEKRKETIKKSREKNKERVIETRKKYSQNKRKELNEYSVRRRKENPVARISHNMRGKIKDFLKIKNFRQTNKTFEIVGCSPQELKEHLEKQFTNGMSWDNYGYYGWHIDHIIPLDSATTQEDTYKLCYYTNLQPLWGCDNLSKNNKIQ